MREKTCAAKYDVDQCDSYGKRIAVQLAAGNFEAARDILDTAENELTSDPDQRPVMEWSLAEIDVDIRALNAIEKHLGVMYVHDLVEHYTPDDLYDVPNLAETTIRELQYRLNEHGIEWGQSEVK